MIWTRVLRIYRDDSTYGENDILVVEMHVWKLHIRTELWIA